MVELRDSVEVARLEVKFQTFISFLNSSILPPYLKAGRIFSLFLRYKNVESLIPLYDWIKI